MPARVSFSKCRLWLALGIVLAFCGTVVAQNNQPPAGIRIDPEGVITPAFSRSASTKLAEQRRRAAESMASGDVSRASDLRKVSLVRLEEAYQEFADDYGKAPAEMRFLAGVQRIDYVFVDAEGRDVVIAGPAEGFAADETGRVRGVKSGRPPLRLDDLIVALRGAERGGVLGCSIDPVPERLAEMQRYNLANRTPASPAVVEGRFREMARILGLQEVTIWGVPAESHLGQIFVEADYRMKRLSVGLDNPRVKGFRSNLALSPGGDSLQRFWFVPLYDPFQTTADRTVFQFSGPRLQLLSQDEYADLQGRRSDAPTTRVSTQKFAKLFTELLPELAEEIPAFAELQNAVDLGVCGGLLKTERIAERVGWTMPLFLDEQRCRLPEGPAPRKVASVMNYRRGPGGSLLAAFGGVMVDPVRSAREVPVETERSDELVRDGADARAGARPEPHPWWWD